MTAMASHRNVQQACSNFPVEICRVASEVQYSVGRVKVSIAVCYVCVEGIITTLMLPIYIILTKHCGIM
jgi:hypothetical protein